MRIKIISILGLLIVSFMPSFVGANQFDMAMNYVQSGEFKKALPIFETLAESGSSLAQANLGMMYLHGDGVDRDINKASYWYEKAATSGDDNSAVINSMYQMAILFRGYLNHASDSDKSFYWYLQAAKKGDVESMNQVGVHFYDGNGVKKNYASAYEWFLKAAKKNHPESQSFIGDLYRFGRGVNKDYVEAISWYKKSARHNYPHALYMLAVLHGQGLGVKADRGKANIFYKKAAAAGHPEAQKIIARIGASDIVIQAKAKDPQYGYSSEKAIRTGGPGASKQLAFLDQLRGPKGQVIQYERTGACGAYKYASAPFGQALIDCYSISYEGLVEPVTLFLDLYRAEIVYAPNGFTFVK